MPASRWNRFFPCRRALRLQPGESLMRWRVRSAPRRVPAPTGRKPGRETLLPPVRCWFRCRSTTASCCSFDYLVDLVRGVARAGRIERRRPGFLTRGHEQKRRKFRATFHIPSAEIASKHKNRLSVAPRRFVAVRTGLEPGAACHLVAGRIPPSLDRINTL